MEVKNRTLAVSLLILSAIVSPIVASFAADGTTQPNPPATRAAMTSGATGSHDPSRMILCDGKYYVYSTGGGMKYSPDQVTWTAGASPFGGAAPATAPAGGRRGRATIPASVAARVPQNQGIWAPDVIYFNNQYYLYYSVAAAGNAPGAPNGRGVIGLLTNPTLDPSSPKYKWTDAGVVLSTENKVEKRCAIDPAPFLDAKGDLWLAWGSGYNNGNGPTDPTILISKLDNATGLASREDSKQYPVAAGHIEAGYVHYHDGFYYAFWNEGGCCSGTSSTYRIHMARSKTVTGPYADKAGKDGAGDIFMATVKGQELYGPGHMGIQSDPAGALDRFTFHYYNAAARPVLGVRTLVWGADGWPCVGEDLPPGTYKITADNGQALGVKGGGAADGSLIELQPSTGSDFQKWTVDITPEGYYELKSVGSGQTVGLASRPAGAQQQWIIELLSDGKGYCLKSGSNQMALGFSTAEGVAGETSAPAGLTTSRWSNIPSQKWIIRAP